MIHISKHLIKYRFLLLTFFLIIATCLHFFKIDFPCINSDEASFAYNAFSIAETGRDEYGKTLPSRFLAFGENKLPVTIYTMVPFIKLLGFSDFSSRLPFIFIGILAPLLFYFLAKKIFKNDLVALTSAFLASISPWIQILTRHIHEDAVILLLGAGILYALSLLNRRFSWKYIAILSILSGLGLFTYHIGKMLAVFVVIWVFIVLKNHHVTKNILIISASIMLLPILIFFFSEISHPTSRISNLLFTSNQGFTLEIENLRQEHDVRLLHNKVTTSIQTLSHQYLSYFSPEFLVFEGDANLRFGTKGVSPITPVEYILFGIGLYYLFKNKESDRYLILSFMLTAPFAASFSWQTQSLTRAYILIIPLILVSSYGLYHLGKNVGGARGMALTLLVLGGIIYFTFFSWEYYFFHYAKKENVGKAWQCGYRSLVSEVASRQDDFDSIVVTRRLGQPYIFFLYYLGYSPEKYQQQASLSPPDEYGFGQVDTFDKYRFIFKSPQVADTKILFVGTPDDFSGTALSRDVVDVISWNGNDVFWIYPKKDVMK